MRQHPHAAIWQRTASRTYRIEADGGTKYTHMVPLRTLAVGIAAWSQDQSRVVIIPLDKVTAVVPE